jgi:glycosyltransferase involved in cell wall biosynthesis
VLRIAVDALNLAIDRRGMGRFARAVLDMLCASDDLALTLIVRDVGDARDDAAMLTPPHRSATLAEARRQRFDAVWYPWNGMRFTLEAPSVATIHDAFAFAYPHRNPIARRREQAPIRRAVERAEILTTVSRFSARTIAAQFGLDSERFTIASPVPTRFWSPVATKRGGEYMLFIAGPEPRKNAALLFRAFATAFEKNRMLLVIAGTLGKADERALLRSGVPHERVAPSDEQLREFYAGAMAVVIPSQDEGYGLPAVEAMACGAPVIAAESGGLPEACDGAALLVPPNAIDEWQASLRLVARDAQLRHSLRERSLARAARIDRDAPGRIIGECLRQAAETGR